ncbi:MAG TPA: MFS transporter, partial [Verrucomicrobiae bacterium]|nr:MFS transporter [Verrucomicrobiae bacterium]
MKLSLREKIGYGFGDAASSMFWKLFSAYLTYFYTNIFGIAPKAVGTMMLITRTWDSAFDPFVGVMGDRTNTRWGKFRPYLLWMAIPFGIIGVLTFTTPSLGMGGKLIYAYVTYSLMMTIYSLINVPYAALMGVMTADSKERTSLATFRFVFAFGGSLVVLAAAEPLANFFGGNGANPQRGWQWMAATFALGAVVLFLLTFLWTRERIKPVAAQTSLKNDLADLGRNFPWFVLLGAGIATIFFNTIRDGVAVFYFKYSLGNDSAFTVFNLHFTWTSMYFVLGQAANIVGVVVAKSVSDRIGKKNTFMLAMFLASIFSVGFYWLNRDQVVLVFVLQFIVSLNAGIIFPLLWPMYADAADYSEWKRGRRSTGLVFSASSMSQKFGWTFGSALAAWLLGFYGYDATQPVQGAATQNGIRVMMSFYPALGALASGAFMLIYPLKEPLMEKIEAELAARRV